MTVHETQSNETWSNGSKLRTVNIAKPEVSKKRKFVYLDKYEIQMQEVKDQLEEANKDIQKLYHLSVVLASSIVLYAVYKLVIMIH